MAITTNQGYDVTTAQKALPDHNGFLEFNSEKVPLWVYEVQMGFGLAGETAQSATTRSFFPHNIEQMMITVACQAPNQEVYGNTIEFIRSGQKGLSNLTRLGVYGRGYVAGRRLKGYHQPIHALGYIETVQRSHKQFEYAPDFNFQFVVADLYSPNGWGDHLVTIRRLKSWQAIVEGIMESTNQQGFTADPDARPDPNSPNTAPPVFVTPGPNGQPRPG